MSQRAHVAAVQALLAADVVLTVFVGESPNLAAPPYVVLYPAMPLVTDEGLCGTPGMLTHDFQTTAVGESVEQAQWVADHVAVALLGNRPAIAGKATGLVRKEYTQPARRDDDVEDVFYAIDGWSFTSN